MATLIFQRYLGRSIVQSSFFVLCAFLAMFLFFDFLAEMEDVGPGYSIVYAIAYVLLGLPSRAIELAPIAALIGTLWALSQSAANSEFTVFRVSGLMPKTVFRSLLAIGLPMVVVTALFAEVVAPFAENWRSDFREKTAGSSSGVLRSGLWLRDVPESSGAAAKGTRFVNAARFNRDQTLQDMVVYDFDERQRLVSTIESPAAEYLRGSDGRYEWGLRNARVTEFATDGQVRSKIVQQMVMASMLSPEMLGALVTKPDRMTSLDLYRYVQYLKQNKQHSDSFEIALWKRLTYPFAIWVMMALALPVAFLQARSGVVGARVFAGILIGIGFHLLNSLFSHLGVITSWPAPMMAVFPSMLALSVATVFFYWAQRR